MWSLRVRLAPIFAKKGRVVLGARVGLVRLGPSGDLSTSDERKPALLRFQVAYFDEARNAKPEFTPHATLAGEVFVTASGPRFVLPTAAEIEYLDAPPEDENLAQKLALELAAETFENVPKDAAGVQHLRLPDRPETAKFLELGVELEVNGAPEAALAVNDVLDVPLDMLSFFNAQVVDDKEEPLADRAFELTVSDGSIIEGQLDADGFARANPIPAGRCKLKVLPDAADLEQA